MVSFGQAILSARRSRWTTAERIRWYFRQQEQDEELEMNGEEDVDLPLIDEAFYVGY